MAIDIKKMAKNGQEILMEDRVAVRCVVVFTMLRWFFNNVFRVFLTMRDLLVCIFVITFAISYQYCFLMMDDIDQIWNRMLSGERYDAMHPGLHKRLADTRRALWRFNALSPDDVDEQRKIIRDLLGAVGERFHINQPFRCDYGCNIFIGENFFANFNLTVLDEARVTIGNNVFIGPNVSIYTACHPLEEDERNLGVEWAEPVTIGNSVWLGGGVTIVPGVTIGNNVVVGAGAVVTRDVPSNVVVAGNPARIIKRLDAGE